MTIQDLYLKPRVAIFRLFVPAAGYLLSPISRRWIFCAPCMYTHTQPLKAIKIEDTKKFVFGVADSKYFVLSFSRTHPSTKIVLRNANFLVEESQGKPWCLWGNPQVRNARRTSGKFAPTGDIHRWN